MKSLKGKELLQEHYDEMRNILDMIKVGVFIADGEGTVLLVNKESDRTSDIDADKIIGRNMKELEAEGYVDQSSVLKAIETKGEYQLIQNLRDGSSLYLTATPYFRDNKIDLVVCTERDITETKNLEILLSESKKLYEKQAKELEYLRAKNNGQTPKIVFKSKKMEAMMATIERVAPLDATVLILGESGVGKEVVADHIVAKSSRKNKPFVKINCAAIPESLLESEMFGYEKGSFTGADNKGRIGIFEMANGGSLFLDEIAEIPMRLQAKLLRVLQEKEIRRVGGKETIPINVRIIAATNIDLEKAVAEGRLREDLYYRLQVMPIEVPPLRERREDIRVLVLHFLEHFYEQYRIKKTISEEAIDILAGAPWHGNIRELKNLIERIVISFDSDCVTARQVKSLIYPDTRARRDFEADDNESLDSLLESYEREILHNYLERYQTAAEVARKLQINKSTVGRKLKKYNIR